MRVNELIKKLQRVNPDAEVRIEHWNNLDSSDVFVVTFPDEQNIVHIYNDTSFVTKPSSTRYNDGLTMCDWCEDLFCENELKETNLGFLCPICVRSVHSRGESITTYDHK